METLKILIAGAIAVAMLALLAGVSNAHMLAGVAG